MQLTGDRFTTESGLAGNDLMTFPDYPAEIRAPAGTVAGVSSFQLHFSDHSIHTAGDAPDMLVAMNPAALIKHMKDLKPGGTSSSTSTSSTSAACRRRARSRTRSRTARSPTTRCTRSGSRA
jgi:Pyruvate/2-oxoacid:ferredoxin oxidoreductase gamma subunit